jgi:hypothetical protein
MARSRRFRKALVGLCALLVVLVGAAGEVSPASSLSLPLETPTTVTVSTPPLTVTATTPTVKAPTISTPTVPLKTPTVSVKAPTVTAPLTTTSATTPTVAVKTPTISATAPTVGVKTSGGSTSLSGAAPTVSAKAGSGSSTSSTGQAAAPAGSTKTGSSGSTGGGAAGASPLAAYGTPGSGYGQLPPSEGPLGHRERARLVHRERALKAIVARFHGCLTALASTRREVLELRTGYGDESPLSPRATAARLHLDPASVVRLEKQAVRELRAAASTHSCARTAALVAGVMAYVAATIGAGPGGPGATGGVEAVRYESPAATASRPAQSTVGRILGTNISPTASDVLLVLFMLMALGTILSLVIADAAGQGPRHAEWRQRVANRLRALR